MVVEEVPACAQAGGAGTDYHAVVNVGLGVVHGIIEGRVGGGY